MPQISVTVTAEELAQLRRGAECIAPVLSLSNYVRRQLGLPDLGRGRNATLAVPPASVPSAFADAEPPQTGSVVMSVSPVSFTGCVRGANPPLDVARREPTEADFDDLDEEEDLHEQTIVYDADEPVEVEGEFEARPHAGRRAK